ncbi:MAG: hypothetical protein M0019_11130 [Actinomycetota bacterium]|nr:hypothetical protein [Actinomycetota bacterium]
MAQMPMEMACRARQTASNPNDHHSIFPEHPNDQVLHHLDGSQRIEI